MDQKCRICNIVKTALSFVFTLVMIAALLGAYVTFGSLEIAAFGSEVGSLSILAVVITLMLWTTDLDCSTCAPPKFQQWVIFVVLILATIASILGITQTHFRQASLIVGTREGSLAIIAFVVTATYWAKHVQSLCGFCGLKK